MRRGPVVRSLWTARGPPFQQEHILEHQDVENLECHSRDRPPMKGLDQLEGGMYSSAPDPPAAKTCPSGRRVRVKNHRGVVIEPVDAQLPVAGSYSSAVLRIRKPSHPPAIRTRPSGRSVVLASALTPFMLPVGVQTPVAGS